MDFNKAFNLVTLYISNIYTIKVFSLECEERQNTKTAINNVQDFQFLCSLEPISENWKLFICEKLEKLMAIDHTSFEKNLSFSTPPPFIPQQPAKLNISYVK